MNYQAIGNLIQEIVKEHHHCHSKMMGIGSTTNKTEFLGAYAAYVSTSNYLETIGLTNEILPLTEQMEQALEWIGYNYNYQSIFQIGG